MVILEAVLAAFFLPSGGSELSYPVIKENQSNQGVLPSGFFVWLVEVFNFTGGS